MNLHHLTDRCLRHIRVDPILPGLDESFADPPGSVARLRGRASVIRIGRAVLDGGQARRRYTTALPGTPAKDRAERTALHAFDRMVEDGEIAAKLGDPYDVGLPVLAALEPWTRAARGVWRMTLEEFRSASNRPSFRGRWDKAMCAVVDGLVAIGRMELGDEETLDVCEILARMRKRR